MQDNLLYLNIMRDNHLNIDKFPTKLKLAIRQWVPT